MAFQFNPHRNLTGCHAFLSASGYHWLNYDDEKLMERYSTYQAASRGSKLHDFAATAIELGQNLANNGSTISMYVNDAIKYHMQPEQPLYYSENCFGTADTISFKNNFLRIHDLKTGETPASVLQVRIYAALFCLEYHIRPESIKMELRIYQSGEKIIDKPTAEDIRSVMDKIQHFDNLLIQRKREEI